MMTMMGPLEGLGFAMAGISRGKERAYHAAKRISAEPTIDAIVDLKLAKAQITASAKVARTLDDMVGSLIDDLA